MLAERAKEYLLSHGNVWEVHDTPEGLLVKTIGSACGPHEVDHEAYADRYFEEAEVFPVHFEPSPKDGFAEAHVDGRAIRAWLGY